jgi:hypothetical protein
MLPSTLLKETRLTHERPSANARCTAPASKTRFAFGASSDSLTGHHGPLAPGTRCKARVKSGIVSQPAINAAARARATRAAVEVPVSAGRMRTEDSHCSVPQPPRKLAQILPHASLRFTGDSTAEHLRAKTNKALEWLAALAFLFESAASTHSGKPTHAATQGCRLTPRSLPNLLARSALETTCFRICQVLLSGNVAGLFVFRPCLFHASGISWHGTAPSR